MAPTDSGGVHCRPAGTELQLVRLMATRAIKAGEELTCDHGGYRRLPVHLMAPELGVDHRCLDEVATVIKAVSPRAIPSSCV